MTAEAEARLARLRRLWDQHRATPPPGGSPEDPRHQEIALYASWLGGIVAQTLEQGSVAPLHRRMLAQRRAEGGRELWAAGAELGEPARSYLARLIAMEELLAEIDSMSAP